MNYLELDKIGDRIKKVREAEQATQAEFAKQLGISKTTFFNYEKGLRAPDANFLVALNSTYGTDILWVLTGAIKPVEDYTITSRETKIIQNLRRSNGDMQEAIFLLLKAHVEPSGLL